MSKRTTRFLSSACKPRPELDSLLSLVQHNRFGAATRVLYSIIDYRKLHQIIPHIAYESAALSALRWDDPSRTLREFSIWFKLVPSIDHPNAPTTSNPNVSSGFFDVPFKRTIQCLLQSGRPSANIPLIKEFALICASKGYVNLVYNWVLGPLSRMMKPASDFAQFLNEIEAAAVSNTESAYKAHTLASQLRVAAVQLLCEVRCHKLAQDVLESNAADERVVLPNEIYEYVIQQLQNARKLRQGRVRGVSTLRKLQEAENVKRLNLRRSPTRSQEPLRLLLSRTSRPPAQPINRRPAETDFEAPAYCTDLQSRHAVDEYTNDPFLNLSTRLAICHSTLDDIESKLIRLRPFRHADLRALLYDILLLVLPSYQSNGRPTAITQRYIALVDRCNRLRERALSSPFRRLAMSWLFSEIVVYDHVRDYRQIFRLVKSYYSLEDLPEVYSETLVDLMSELDKDADVGAGADVDPAEEEEDRIVLEPTSRVATVLVKWLVIQTGLRVHPDPSRSMETTKAKQDLVRLWDGLCEYVPELRLDAQGGGGGGRELETRDLHEQVVFQELVAALIWSFSKAGEYHTLVRPRSAFFTRCRVTWLRDVWLSLEKELGASPSWAEFSAFVQREREQEAAAEVYLEMVD